MLTVEGLWTKLQMIFQAYCIYYTVYHMWSACRICEAQTLPCLHVVGSNRYSVLPHPVEEDRRGIKRHTLCTARCRSLKICSSVRYFILPHKLWSKVVANQWTKCESGRPPTLNPSWLRTAGTMVEITTHRTLQVRLCKKIPDPIHCEALWLCCPRLGNLALYCYQSS